ncbi:MAG: O-sialoglycoprotein endopeptidase [Parcubacteria bacterium C7867-005]|nr:MAG: O-sialoglycoprotein endopeptidase [Parcubacteria bacterium C7867-005]
MKILAIETSCDETAIAILEAEGGLKSPEFKVLGNTLVSQIDLHKEFGGVYPNLARREHAKNLVPILLTTLRQAFGESKYGLKPTQEMIEKIEKILTKEPDLYKLFSKEILEIDKPNIDSIAVTTGPGLEPALWVGIVFAEALGVLWDLPVYPVNHMEGHIYSPLLNLKEKLVFPALALLVSGGHTELVYIKNFGEYKIVGKTRDDAVGEAFDKVARLLDLPYPGGPKVSALAELHRSKNLVPTFSLPRPMINSKDLDFSFSGLKTSVLYKLKETGVNENIREEMSHEFEDSAVEVLISKTEQALEKYDTKTLIVAGGVSQNIHLQRELHKLADKFSGLDLLLPEKSLTTDNAVMIGISAYIQISGGKVINKLSTGNPERLKANGNLSF